MQKSLIRSTKIEVKHIKSTVKKKLKYKTTQAIKADDKK